MEFQENDNASVLPEDSTAVHAGDSGETVSVEETTLQLAAGKRPLPDGKINEQPKAVLG